VPRSGRSPWRAKTSGSPRKPKTSGCSLKSKSKSKKVKAKAKTKANATATVFSLPFPALSLPLLPSPPAFIYLQPFQLKPSCNHLLGACSFQACPAIRISAMKRFFVSAASSSSGSAARPASTAAPSSSASAERPGTSTTFSNQVSITTLLSVQLWLAEDHIATCTSAEIQRIREAVGVLSRSKPRQEDLAPLFPKWQVSRWQSKKSRPLADMVQEFQGKSPAQRGECFFLHSTWWVIRKPATSTFFP
jgi:hypothetical protein